MKPTENKNENTEASIFAEKVRERLKRITKVREDAEMITKELENAAYDLEKIRIKSLITNEFLRFTFASNTFLTNQAAKSPDGVSIIHDINVGSQCVLSHYYSSCNESHSRMISLDVSSYHLLITRICNELGLKSNLSLYDKTEVRSPEGFSYDQMTFRIQLTYCLSA